MSVPCNSQDFKRFAKLAKQLSTTNPASELRLYTDNNPSNGEGTYVSLELTGYLPTEKVAEIFAAPAQTPQEEAISLLQNGLEEGIEILEKALTERGVKF